MCLQEWAISIGKKKTKNLKILYLYVLYIWKVNIYDVFYRIKHRDQNPHMSWPFVVFYEIMIQLIIILIIF